MEGEMLGKNERQLNDTQWRILAYFVYCGGSLPQTHSFVGLGAQINKSLRFLVARELLTQSRSHYQITQLGKRLYEEESQK